MVVITAQKTQLRLARRAQASISVMRPVPMNAFDRCLQYMAKAMVDRITTTQKPIKKSCSVAEIIMMYPPQKIYNDVTTFDTML